MNVIAVQFDIAWEDKPANYSKVRALLAAASLPPNSLVVLPEMFATGFSMSAEAIAEDYGGPTEQFLASTAREFGIGLVGGVAMKKRIGKPRNKALAFSPAGELIGYYAKMRPFTPGGESDHYAAGRDVARFSFGGWTVAPFICYDLRFPELFREVAAGCQPELYLVIASWPEKRVSHWVRLLQARAIENQAYVVGVNRVGADPYYRYAGRSVIVDPQGEILQDAGECEGLIMAALDLEGLRKYREGLPFLKDLMHGLQKGEGARREA